MNNNVLKIIEDLGLDIDEFSQSVVIRNIENPFCEAWTIVYDSPGIPNNSTAMFSCFVKRDLEDTILDGQDWLKHSDEFSPGFSVCGGETQYFTGQDEGYEPIILSQCFYAFEETQLLLNQEFILLLGLYKDSNGDYYSIGDSGEKEKVVEFAPTSVKVRTKYILRYMSAKQLLYVQFVDSRVSSPGRYPFNPVHLDNQDFRGETYNYFNSYQTNSDNTFLFSMIYARSIVKPNAIETCGIWPYEKDDEEYPEFIIEELPNGEYRRFSCRESGLANYFGGNPGSPHYLTPIFFKPSVLDKYRRDTVFTVSERRITCGAQWGVEIDNVNPDRVMVFLGDIGRDLPEAERKHFLQYEMSPINQAISREVYANDFLSLWTEATGPITKFLNAHNKLNKTWESSFGWLLYREYHPEDENIQQQIRIPSSNGQEEFDTVILSLAKMVVDYIDEAKLQSSQTGSINKLEDFLNQHNISVDLSAIRNLQSLRSSGIAHSKGGKYESLRDSLLTGNSIDNAKAIIAKLTEFLISLSLVLENENQEA